MSIRRWGVWSPESVLCQVHHLAGVSPCGETIMTAMGIFLQGCPKQRLMGFTWSSLAWWRIKSRTGCIHYPQEGAIRSTVEACTLEHLFAEVNHVSYHGPPFSQGSCNPKPWPGLLDRCRSAKLRLSTTPWSCTPVSKPQTSPGEIQSTLHCSFAPSPSPHASYIMFHLQWPELVGLEHRALIALGHT